jgi:type IV pilus assembly protein PilZ
MINSRAGFLNLSLSDKHSLHRHYMPFLRGGGLFVPTNKNFSIGDEVFALVQLPEEQEKRPVSGKVAWLSSQCHVSGRPAGIGVQLMETPENESVRNRIDVLLAGIPTDAPTFTL